MELFTLNLKTTFPAHIIIIGMYLPAKLPFLFVKLSFRVNTKTPLVLLHFSKIKFLPIISEKENFCVFELRIPR